MEILKISIPITTSSTSMKPDNIEILGIDNDNILNIKYTVNEVIMYLEYTLNMKIYTQLFFEIIEKSPLWYYTIKILTHTGRHVNYAIHEINLSILINEELIIPYLDQSLALNYIIIEKFIDDSLFVNTDLSNKSIIPLHINGNNFVLSNTFRLTLYNYQSKSLEKMISLENQTNELFIDYSYKMDFVNIKLILDPFTKTKINNKLKLNIKSKGGILADEMGLGKTITSIALIISNPSPNNLPNINMNNKINSKATLIICPSHLAKQWEREIKRCVPDLKITTVLSKTEYNYLKFKDFIDSDIIITSHQFIMNFKFYPTLYYKPCTSTSFNSIERTSMINRFVLETICDLSFEEIRELKQPLFDMFHFHRIYVDEGHEIYGESLKNNSVARYMSDWISSINCTYTWFISGTPFINYSSVKNAANFIKLSLHDYERNISFTYDSSINSNAINSFIHKEYLWNNILEKICIRHRKCDVEDQILIPGYIEKIIWLNFTDIEKQLYDAKKDKMTDSYLQQLCCHPLVVETSRKIFGNAEVDLSVMQDKLIEFHKKNYDNYKIKLEKLIPGKPEYHMLKKTYQNQISESYYLYSMLEKMKDPEYIDKLRQEICCICMDEMKLPVMTNCGHLYCSLCLNECITQRGEICPMCKANLKGKEIIVVKKKTNSNDNSDNPLIKKYGSKLGKLISYVKSLVELDDSRIIIFSQWDDMLSLISKTLIDNDINNSFVKGNIWRRTSAITKFQEGVDNKVIMLSLKNAASGTNLTNATHIFFVEPINASKEEINAIESQAIARACRIGQKETVSVIRILIKDTIEEEIYNQYYV